MFQTLRLLYMYVRVKNFTTFPFFPERAHWNHVGREKRLNL